MKKYVELDFDEITSRKAAFIKKSKVLSDVLGPSVTIGEFFVSTSSSHAFSDRLRPRSFAQRNPEPNFDLPSTPSSLKTFVIPSLSTSSSLPYQLSG